MIIHHQDLDFLLRRAHGAIKGNPTPKVKQDEQGMRFQLQLHLAFLRDLEFEIWSFPEVWSLEFEAFTAVAAASNNAACQIPTPGQPRECPPPAGPGTTPRGCPAPPDR